MLPIKCKLVDFNGEEKTVIARFNYTEAEVLDMEAGRNMSISDYLKIVVDAKDKDQIYAAFKDFVLDAYGELSDDGLTFMKTPAIREKFKCSAVFNHIMMKFVTDSNSFGPDFINGVLPDMETLNKKLENNQKTAISVTA